MPLSSFPPVASSRSASVMIARAGIVLCAARNEMIARLPLQRVYSPIAVTAWQTSPSSEFSGARACR